MGEKVKIVEVGPRDGLQNEAKTLSVEDRAELIQKLIATGEKFLEGGSFVSPKAIPQMVDSEKVLEKISGSVLGSAATSASVDLSFLVPNEKGLERALEAKVKSIAIFTATSDSFTEKNIGMKVADSLKVFESVAKKAIQEKLRLRGYVSTAFGCPYEGSQKAEKVLEVTEKLLAMGCDEVSIGDTIGVAHPKQIEKVFSLLARKLGSQNFPHRIAGHFHDTRGMALLNIKTSLDLGLRTFDSSIGGLGGCPYAKGSSGNVATEEVVWSLEGLGFSTGISVEKLLEVAAWIESKIGRPLKSRLYLSRPLSGPNALYFES
ncbi:MAG: hydroxymethylglutaryl-CoA lyase [Deltaproteobacteria bacterium]|nr:hydroxymethylglutaryl-CoA lyase [Deltaproteobacteria bacterium]